MSMSNTLVMKKTDVEMSKLVPKRERYTEDNRDDNLTSTSLLVLITELISNKLKFFRTVTTQHLKLLLFTKKKKNT